MGVIILHEYTHYGDAINGDKYRYFGASFDEGDMMELKAYGEDINTRNYTTILFDYITN